MMYRRVFWGLVVAAALAFNPAHALDGDTIDRWIGSMEDLQVWGEQQPDDLEDELMGDEDPADLDFEAMMSRAAGKYGEINNIIREHGFRDGDEWAHVGGRIYDAFIALQMDTAAPEMQRQMDEAMRQLEQNPNISEQQKEQMRQQMEEQMQAMTGMTEDVTEADKQAVREKEAELNRLFEIDEQQHQHQRR